MFTSLRLGVMWRTEQLIYYYIKMTWASAVCYCQATWFRVGDRVHLERDCIIFPSPPFGTASGFVLAAPCFLIDSIINSTRHNLSAVPSYGGMWGVADCGRCIVRELCCHSALNLVLLCNHVLSRVGYLPVAVIRVVVVPIGVVSSAPVAYIHRVPV